MPAPLADRMRPKNIDEMVGQEHILGENAPLRNIISSGNVPNMIFYGPSGTGKTTLSRIIASSTHKKLHKLNGTNASTADIRAIASLVDTLAAPNGILLYLDEIQYFNKKQQQSLLEYVESGKITLIASTTENPYFYVYNALLSRATVFEFKLLSAKDISISVLRAFNFLQNERGEEFDIEDGVIEHISSASGGDVRKAINAAELCVLASNIPKAKQKRHISIEIAKNLSQKSAMRYDREGDEHYDLLSAYQKSMRGSDTDAALHYLARLLEVGDLISSCRRLLVCACEDVGLAYPMIMPIVKAAVDIAMQVGLPEAQIPLANAVVLVCNSPKSNSGADSISSALKDVKDGKTYAIPRNLQNNHFDGEDAEIKGQFYLYPHDYPNHWVSQQYLPSELLNAKYYKPASNKNEQAMAEYWRNIKNQKK